MKNNHNIRFVLIPLMIFLGILWSFNSAVSQKPPYPNAQFITTAPWLHSHLNDKGLIVVDVRSGDHFDGNLIPGAVHVPWSDFRYNDLDNNLASTFVGIREAKKILGDAGITRPDTVILYDSVERDGGATASYVFWVLDMLGHQNKKILERGIDAWTENGYDRVTTARKPVQLLYQAGLDEVRKNSFIDGNFVYRQLDDPFYQIVDTRSAKEYLGNAGTKGLDGTPLKLGHIPTAVNINYTDAWTDPEKKGIRPYAELQKLYRGIDPSKGIIVYCNSGRRSSFSYYILRLMGFKNVFAYEASWKEWGNPGRFFPVETTANTLTDNALPGVSTQVSAQQSSAKKADSPTNANKPDSGYIFCGG
jgi:thiosulfate/3-mercaptopyruvate sulfurtransferase